jgi:hypothetical protein
VTTSLVDATTVVQEPSRSLRINARQHATSLEQTEIWHGIDDVSLIDENPELSAEPMMVRAAVGPAQAARLCHSRGKGALADHS